MLLAPVFPNAQCDYDVLYMLRHAFSRGEYTLLNINATLLHRFNEPFECGVSHIYCKYESLWRDALVFRTSC